MLSLFSFIFFFNDTATTEIYTLSLHDALPISSATAPRTCRRTIWCSRSLALRSCGSAGSALTPAPPSLPATMRSEEHTSELQSHLNLVCRLLLEKKKKKQKERRARSTSETSHL